MRIQPKMHWRLSLVRSRLIDICGCKLFTTKLAFSLTDFNGMSTCLGLFYALRLVTYVHCMSIITFFCICFLKSFCTRLYDIKYAFINSSTQARCDTRSIFLSGIQQVWIQNFPSQWWVAIQNFKSPICLTIYLQLEGE